MGGSDGSGDGDDMEGGKGKKQDKKVDNLVSLDKIRALYTKPRVNAGVQWTPGTLCGVRWTPGSVQANLVTTKNSVKMGMESMWIPHRLQTKCLDFPWIPEDWSQCGLMWTPWTPHSICIHA